ALRRTRSRRRGRDQVCAPPCVSSTSRRPVPACPDVDGGRQDGGMEDALTLDDGLTLWSPEARDGMPLLVLLHGYGADENDLFGLIPYLPDGIAVASVAAPLAPQWPMPGR